jgi:hypothetical protein
VHGNAVTSFIDSGNGYHLMPFARKTGSSPLCKRAQTERQRGAPSRSIRGTQPSSKVIPVLYANPKRRGWGNRLPVDSLNIRARALYWRGVSVPTPKITSC